MICTMCGSQRFETTHTNKPSSPKFLPEIVLLGLRKDSCLECGEYEIEYPQYSQLLELITVALLNKKRLLAPGEIRWLRTRLGKTSAQMAELLKVSATTVSYWENGHRKASPTADLALRLLLMFTVRKGSFSPEASPGISTKSNTPLELRLRFDGTRWNIQEPAELVLPLDSFEQKLGQNQPLWGIWPQAQESPA